MEIFNDSVAGVCHLISFEHSFLLCDSHATLLSKNGRGTDDKKGIITLKTGTSFTEESIGTNSIILSHLLKNEVALLPQHHYCELLSDWYEYCVPLSYNNETIGFMALITVSQPIPVELMAITKLLCQRICSMYPLETQHNTASTDIRPLLNYKQSCILKLTAKGLTDYSISKTLNLSISTVKYHKQNILKKYHVGSSIEAVVKALKLKHILFDDLDI